MTEIDYLNPLNQAAAVDEELGIGTSTRLLLHELEDEVHGTSVERSFFRCVRSFYEVTIAKILDKFPFKDAIIKELSFLDPQQRAKCTVSGITHLATRFSSFSSDDIDTLISEFQFYRIASNDMLPTFQVGEAAAVDYFWTAMSEVRCAIDKESFQYELLSKLAKILLVLPHSNADPERLFSMVRKICTEQRDPSTICDLLCVKLNNSNPCYDNKDLLSQDSLRSVKTAALRSLDHAS
jgi:hypothetical protein